MICEDYRFIFVHIPKTGGTSIKNSLPRCDSFFTITRNHFFASKYHDKYPNFTKFAFVRNPFDRIVSYYNFLTKQSVSFIHFLKNFTNNVTHEFKMKPYLTDDEGNVIVDFIGRFENLQNDYNTICNKLRISRNDLTWDNKSRYNSDLYKRYYNEESFELVNSIFKEDIEFLGYQF